MCCARGVVNATVPSTSVVGFDVQSLRFGMRELSVTMVALPEFVSARRTNLPEVVLAFCLVLVTVLVGLIVVGAAIHNARVKAEEQRRSVEEQHKASLLKASTQAYERTIAYACHQLRSARLLTCKGDRVCVLRASCCVSTGNMSGGRA